MIRVWSDNQNAGLLDRFPPHGNTFAYAPGTDRDRAVSLTMPVRLASWNHAFGMHPIFEMNLPEGVLRERLRLSFAKATGRFDEFDLLSVVGRSQVGRLRYTAPDAILDEAVPFQSVDEILRHRRDGELFDYMLDRFAAWSGISGVQPKVLVRDETAFEGLDARRSASLMGATHIVKFWDLREYPQLAANEFFCLRAAELSGLDVPRYRLADDGGALVIDRFDLRPDGTYRGLEDFCVLNAQSTADKYRGGYETAVFKRAAEFIGPEEWPSQARQLFTLFALNCAVRNGDAHLKNFSLIYDDVNGALRLSPVYDVVTTTAYLPKDTMALTFGGSTRWPGEKQLVDLGTKRCGIPAQQVKRIFEQIADGMSKALAEMCRYVRDNPAFAPIATVMQPQWNEGIAMSLGMGERQSTFTLADARRLQTSLALSLTSGTTTDPKAAVAVMQDGAYLAAPSGDPLQIPSRLGFEPDEAGFYSLMDEAGAVALSQSAVRLPNNPLSDPQLASLVTWSKDAIDPAEAPHLTVTLGPHEIQLIPPYEGSLPSAVQMLAMTISPEAPMVPAVPQSTTNADPMTLPVADSGAAETVPQENEHPTCSGPELGD